ncbi:hypothetical protein [Streptomyces noursei]|uniref:hypothetical protein n=1 Tax=Streptomyces noursei TaxID=1971 RepID=UPI0015E12232|nr:hypothetical protein [Streptomyces noursei]
MTFTLSFASFTLSVRCVRAFSRALLRMMMTTKRLQILSVVIVAWFNVINISGQQSAQRAGIDPHPLTQPTITLQDVRATQRPISR